MISGQTLRVWPEGKPVPTFPDHAASNKKAPDLFEAGLRFRECDRDLYARGSPEARQGFAVFAVRLVFMIMGRAYAGDFGRRQQGFGPKIRCNEVEHHLVVTS
jgi:hypothetical protein